MLEKSYAKIIKNAYEATMEVKWIIANFIRLFHRLKDSLYQN